MIYGIIASGDHKWSNFQAKKCRTNTVNRVYFLDCLQKRNNQTQVFQKDFKTYLHVICWEAGVFYTTQTPLQINSTFMKVQCF